MLEAYILGLEIHQPDWWITYATQQDLIDCVRMCTDGHSGTVKAKQQLINRTAERLFMPIRAAIEAGLVVAKS